MMKKYLMAMKLNASIAVVTPDSVTIHHPNAAMLHELLCRAKKISPFMRSKSPTKDEDFSWDEFRGDAMMVKFHYNIMMFGMKLMAFVATINEASFTTHSRAVTLKRLFDAFQPWPDHDRPEHHSYQYRGVGGIDKAIDDVVIMNIIKDHFNPAPGVPYVSASTSTCESHIKLKGKFDRDAEARQFEIYYTFQASTDVAEMMDVLVHGPVEEDLTPEHQEHLENEGMYKAW